MTEPERAVLDINMSELMGLMAFSASFVIYEDAIQNLDLASFTESQVAAFRKLPDTHRMGLAARLVELTESLRESLRALEGHLLVLTSPLGD